MSSDLNTERLKVRSVAKPMPEILNTFIAFREVRITLTFESYVYNFQIFEITHLND